jgi:regulator of protease activity HflC (stomatin/prohibitin superfamily)
MNRRETRLIGPVRPAMGGVATMSERLDAVLEVLRRGVIEPLARLIGSSLVALRAIAAGLWRFRWRTLAAGAAALVAYALIVHPPFASARRGEVLARTDALDGSVSIYSAGTVLVVPGLHQVRRYSIRDQVYRPTDGASATGPAPFQSVEGLSIGVDLTVRWAIDRTRLAEVAKDFPDDLTGDLVAPAVQGIVYPTFARYSVRDIFSQRRTQIQQELAAQLRPKLAALGLVLREVDIGKVDLPPDYRAGLEKLLSEELETEKIHYTLELKQAQLKQQQLEGEADKLRRQTAAEAAGQEQVIAARAQEETMKHILPFKQKQIEQRQLEAEAEKVARIRTAEGAAEARRIEAKGEADSREKLADAEAYRLDLVGKSNAGQMEREGAVVARYPLLIQKTLADKLSDKVQVIIAPLPASGRFIGSSLIGDTSAPNPVDGAVAGAIAQAKASQ